MYKNKPCRFHYFFTKKTITAKPLQTNSEFKKCKVLKKWETVSGKVHAKHSNFCSFKASRCRA